MKFGEITVHMQCIKTCQGSGKLCDMMALSDVENVFRVCIAWYKHERGWKNSRQLWKTETKSKVCITVKNSPNASTVYIRLCKHGKKFFYCFYKITFPRKKCRTLCLALIKREILTSRKCLFTKSCTRNQFLFAKRGFAKYEFFSLKMSA